MSQKFRKSIDEPDMSDKHLLVSVADLIGVCFGSMDNNVVNFKVLQSILCILAGQLRLLEQDVDIRFDELMPETHGLRRKGGYADDEGQQEMGENIEETEIGKDVEAATQVQTAGPYVRRPSIEVVTASKFALLQTTVEQLTKLVGPAPAPTLPENQQLRADLAKGRTSLQDTMLAVQLNARVQAAEQGLMRMADLLRQLVEAGVLPPDVAARVTLILAQLENPTGAAGGAGAAGSQPGQGDQKSGGPDDAGTGPSGTAPFDVHRYDEVSYDQMVDEMKNTKEEVTKHIEKLMSRAVHTVSEATNVARNVADHLESVLKMNSQIATLHEQTVEYTQHVSGFGSVFATQKATFDEQMAVLVDEQTTGLALFDTINNSAETAALLELSKRCQEIMTELESTMNEHRYLDNIQREYTEEIRSLNDCAEMLREQKAECHEVVEGLSDKADRTSLVGMMPEVQLKQTCSDLQDRLDMCLKRSSNIDEQWQNELRNLLNTMEGNADLVLVKGLKETADQDFCAVQQKLQELESLLGEPKAADLMRKLAIDAVCGSCWTRAHTQPKDATYGMPLPLPPLRPPPRLPPPPVRAAPPDQRKHVCRRWAGGSHTVLPKTVARDKKSSSKLHTHPSKKFTGYGFDGRLYMLEEDLPPCAECNVSLPEIVS